MYIQRTISDKIQALFVQYPILTLTGPRQSGKTTLLKYLFAEKLPYVSLEDIDLRSFALEDPRGFLRNYPNGAIFDEVQRAPSLFSYLQTLSDNDSGLKYILSGSQNFSLLEKIGQSLAGRTAILKLLPFSQSELIAGNQNFNTFDTPVFKGGYPRLYAQEIAPTDFYPSYIQTYIERDVRQIKNVGNLNDFTRFLKLCAGRVGQLLNLQSLANDAGISVNTAKSWLSILETSYILYPLQPYFRNFNKRIVKMPKLYFWDTGVLCSLLGITNEAQVPFHYMRGELFENYVITELHKHEIHQGRVPQFYFWRDSNDKEIDLLRENEGNLIPIEIKSGETFSKDYFKTIHHLSPILGFLPDKKYVIYGGTQNFDTSDGKLLSWKNLTDIFSNP